MFVVAHVSSRQTMRAGSSVACISAQTRRASATSSRCCSSAWRCFLERQAQPGHDFPHHRIADTDLMRLRQPGPQLVQRGVRRCLDPSLQRIGEPSQAQRQMAALGAWRGLAQYTQPGADFGHVGRADVEPRRHLHQGHVSAGEHPIPQILSICLPTTPTHLCLRPKPESLESHLRPVSEGEKRFQSSR